MRYEKSQWTHLENESTNTLEFTFLFTAVQVNTKHGTNEVWESEIILWIYNKSLSAGR
jgi:hypothetical protein